MRIVSAARAATGSLRLPDVRRRLADIDDALDQDWLFTVLSALRPGNPAP